MIRRLLASTLVVVVLPACASSGSPTTDNDDGGYATEFVVEDIATGQPVALADLRGGPVLLSSWATWCEECRTELPALDAWAADPATGGLTVVAVNVNLAGPADDEIDKLLDELGLEMPTWRDDQNTFARTFRTFGVPANVLLDADGHVVATWNGAIDPNEPDVVAALTAARAAPTG